MPVPPPAHLSRSGSEGEDAVSWGKGVREVVVVGGKHPEKWFKGKHRLKIWWFSFFFFFKFTIKESPSWGGAGC